MHLHVAYNYTCAFNECDYNYEVTKSEAASTVETEH